MTLDHFPAPQLPSALGAAAPAKGWNARKVALVLVAAFNLAGLAEVAHSYRVERHDAELMLAALSSSTAYQIEAAIRNADGLLVDARDRLGSDNSFPPSDVQYLTGRINAMPEVGDVVFADAGGNAVSTLKHDGEEAKFSALDRDFFQFWRNHPGESGLHLSPPVISRATGQMIVPVSRPRRSASGQFLGTVSTGVKVAFLEDILAAANHRETGSATLFMVDGSIVARVPSLGGAVVKLANPTWNDKPTFKEERKTLDGIPRFVANRRVGDYPLEVGSTMAVAEAMGSWRREVLETFGTSIPLSLAIFVLAMMVDRRERARLAMVAALEAQRDELESAVETRTRELADFSNRLKASNAELEQFAYVASHDLREPLRMISSYISLLGRRYGDRLDGEGHEFLDFARDGALRMDRMVLDLLEFSRVGRLGGQFEPVALGDVVATALGNLKLALEESGAKVTIADGLPGVFGSRGELVRLVQNLLGNALKYRHPQRPPEVAIGWRRQDGQIAISVADNGIGISPEYFERIFSIFQRLHTREKYDGSGIGLAICKKIVEHHGGRIWLESRPNEGSTFHFTVAEENAALALSSDRRN